MRKDRVENETELDGDSGIGSDNEMGMENEYDDTMNQDGSDSFDGDPGDDFYRYDESDVSGDCIGADYDDDHSVKEVLDSTDYMNSLDSIINISEIAEIAAGSISAGNGSSVNSETEKKTEDDGTEKDAQSAGTKEDSDGAVKKDKFQVLIEKGIRLIGTETQKMGDQDVHRLLLGHGVVLLEGVRLQEIPNGRAFLCAQPINLGGAEGAPCRPVLLYEQNMD